MTAIKICGITRAADALAAAHLGAHALGFVFYAGSPRNVAASAAAAITRELPPLVATVGLFVNAQRNEVEAILERVPLTLLQFHGDETPEFCRQFCRPYIKAIRMRANIDLLQYSQLYGDARGLLLDAYVAGSHGGTGTRFDWSVIPEGLATTIVLSGGLNPDNVAEAIRLTKPSAVDVSSGVELSPGIKSLDKLAAFIKEVHGADLSPAG